ncbi:hypothetical protein, partial [Caulobacter sp. D5]|uniref:hypothetical protein n=2 Tax=unclassified Caulobacter TaxID=2648921 RepID=UPI001E4F1880
ERGFWSANADRRNHPHTIKPSSAVRQAVIASRKIRGEKRMELVQWPALIALAVGVVVWGGVILVRNWREAPATAEEDLD